MLPVNDAGLRHRANYVNIEVLCGRCLHAASSSFYAANCNGSQSATLLPQGTQRGAKEGVLTAVWVLAGKHQAHHSSTMSEIGEGSGRTQLPR